MRSNYYRMGHLVCSTDIPLRKVYIYMCGIRREQGSTPLGWTSICWLTRLLLQCATAANSLSPNAPLCSFLGQSRVQSTLFKAQAAFWFYACFSFAHVHHVHLFQCSSVHADLRSSPIYIYTYIHLNYYTCYTLQE